MQQETITLIVAGLGIAGTLGGAIVGNVFQMHGQHQQWRRDNICRECQELLGQLSVTLFAYIDCYTEGLMGEKYSEKYAREEKYRRDAIDLHRNFGSRILIANEIKKANVQERWKAALQSYNAERNGEKLNAEYEVLAEEIASIGKKAIR